ncbi:hypothetical protein AGMMS49982_16320 [Bacteroidia bacterium]|nr:hypothetical protein AGMMS49982_16320 [Bacteroidia bacterium]
MKKNDAEYWFGKGIELNKAERFAEAVECYDETIVLNPENEYVWICKGNALLALQRYDESIKCYDRAIELNSQNEHAWNFKASACASKGGALVDLQRYDEAIECYDEAIKLNPKDEDTNHFKGTTWIRKGFKLFDLKRYEDAIECYDKAIKLNPKDEHAWTFKGNALFELKRYYESIECYDRALEISFEFKWGWHFRGIALAKLKKFQDATKSFDKSGRSILDILMLTIINDEEKKELTPYMLDYDNLFKEIKPQIVANVLTNADLAKYEDVYIRSILIIRELHVKESKEKNVAHYTTKVASQAMLFNGSIFRLSAINYCNDPKEGITLLDYLFDGKQTHKMKQENYGVFAGSFTFNHDYLNQFRLYGKEEKNEGTGVSIVLKNSFFNSEAKLATQSLFESNPKLEENKFSLFRCIYIDPKTGYVAAVGHKEEYRFYAEKENVDDAEIEEYRKSIDKVLKNVREKLKELKYLIDGLEPVIINQLLLNLRYLTKHVAFKEEQECRIVEIKSFTDKDVHPTDDFKHLYIEYLDIRNHVQKIHFGPNATEMKVYRDMLRHHRLKIDCEKSEHPFA